MTRYVRTAVALAAAMTLGAAAACSGGGGGGGGGGTEPQTGTVTGKVSNGSAGVPGVTVSVAGGGTAQTDASGNFSIGSVPTGARTVSLTLPDGFITATAAEPTSRQVNVSAGQAATANFSVKRGVVVTAGGVSFSPQTVTVPAGGTVRWVNAGGVHTVTPENPGQPGAWSDAPLGGGATFEHTFGTAGSFAYYCSPHRAAGMTGTVTVGGSAGVTPGGTEPGYSSSAR